MYRYENVVSRVQRWIEAGVLKPGDRVPSVREMSEQTGFSAVTVHHAYALLESDGIVRASPRSGFYVAASERQDEADITVCKNGGGGHLDLMAARALFDAASTSSS